jgi:hypothetical protein
MVGVGLIRWRERQELALPTREQIPEPFRALTAECSHVIPCPTLSNTLLRGCVLARLAVE